MSLKIKIRLPFWLKSALILWLTMSFGLNAQVPESLRHCKTSEYKMDFYILLKEKKVRYVDSLSYAWFKSQKIHHTQGASAGYLLHGKYFKYYHSGQLAEQGEFEYGLKNGVWMSWDESGKMESVYQFKSGVLHGDFKVYNAEKSTVKAGKFRKGKEKLPREKKTKEVETDEEKPTRLKKLQDKIEEWKKREKPEKDRTKKERREKKKTDKE